MKTKRINAHVRPLTGDDVRRLVAALAFIRENFAKGIILGDVARVSGWRPHHFHRLFKLWHGKTPKRVLSELQIEEAKRQIRAGKALKDVARLSGFANQIHLTHRFTELVQQSPARWARALNGGRRHPDLFTGPEACEYLHLPADDGGLRTLADYRKKRWLVARRHGRDLIYWRKDLDACILRLVGEAR